MCLLSLWCTPLLEYIVWYVSDEVYRVLLKYATTVAVDYKGLDV